jgi:hypothetical protein
MPSIRRLADQLAADKRISIDDAKALVAKAKADGKVSTFEQAQLKNVVAQYKDKFDPGALELIKPLFETVPTPPPAPGGQTVNLDPSGAHRPVFLGANGVITAAADGTPPKNSVELGDAIYRAAELVDDSPKNIFAGVSQETRAAAFENLSKPAPAGLDQGQALQLRSSTATVLLHLIDATPEASLRGAMVTKYDALVRAETDPRLRETMIFHLSNSEAAKSGPAKPVSDALMKELAPLSPPYEKWFAGGNKTVNLSWTVGQGGFMKGFADNLKGAGFKPVGTENSYGVNTYEKTVNKPGVGDTTFRITVREGGTNILAPMNDKNVQIVGYDGHSDWGRNMTASVKNGPVDPTGADGKLLFYNLCVGKGVLDRVREKYPNSQVVTTYAASNFYTDSAGQMTRGEGVQALLAMVDDVAARAPWSTIHKSMNDAANIGWGRTWDNYVTPISTLTREKVLDSDHDGQADYLDKLYNYSTYKVPEDTAREFKPVKQDRPAGVLDGTKVNVSAQMVNTLSEFSTILDQANRDSKVVANGWFEPKMGEREVVRFTQAKGSDGKPEFHMSVNARYSHMSEEALRATTVYEFNRYLANSGQLRMDPVDAKLAGLLVFVQSLKVDDGYRDAEVWKSFLNRYAFPADTSFSAISSVLDSEAGHAYAGSPEMVKALREKLTPAALAAFKKPEVGEAIQIVG